MSGSDRPRTGGRSPSRYALVLAGVAVLGVLVSVLSAGMVLRHRPIAALWSRE
ncbi:hypothetical protein [Actinoallomurus sp. NPDC050550]|uniref:hypothetical protein n=1 Tax=Actinoallomurus sp. NPDC050550 TaxID=3154937 RepID=UPI003409585F